MKRRLFIAINLPGKTKKRLVDYQKKWIELDPTLIRWVKKDNLHVTLLFIGYVDDDEMYEVCKITEQVAKNHEPFMIDLEKIVLGPPNRTPRMFWLQGKKSDELGKLQGELTEKIEQRAGARHDALKPHVTLARFRSPLVKSLPKVNEEFHSQVPVETIEIMQSNLRRGGAEYLVLESIELGE